LILDNGNLFAINDNIRKVEKKMRMNEQVKKFSLLDVKLAQAVAMFVALIIAKLIPSIMDINIWWFVILLVICGIKPFYVFWIKKMGVTKKRPNNELVNLHNELNTLQQSNDRIEQSISEIKTSVADLVIKDMVD